jgi:hypothetical protein
VDAGTVGSRDRWEPRDGAARADTDTDGIHDSGALPGLSAMPGSAMAHVHPTGMGSKTDYGSLWLFGSSRDGRAAPVQEVRLGGVPVLGGPHPVDGFKDGYVGNAMSYTHNEDGAP